MKASIAVAALVVLTSSCGKEQPGAGDDASGESVAHSQGERAVVERWMAAGAGGDADTVWKMIDWGASGAARMATALVDLAALDGDLEPAARAGIAELAASEHDRALVANRMADLMATLNEKPKLRVIEPAERGPILARLGAPLPQGLPPEVTSELTPRLTRARSVDVLFAVESPTGSVELVGVIDDRIVLIPKH